MRIIENTLRIILPYLLAIFLFDYSLDIKIIDPGNINWLMSVYHDWGQHYLGWAFFRSEPWTFPLGEIANYNYPAGTNIGYTDSIPLLGIFFKLFNSFLPDTFQYIGLWMFSSYLLVTFYTLKILKLYKIDFFLSLLVLVFVLINPVLIYRSMHPALFGQWILIGAIYYYLKPSKNNFCKHKVNIKMFILIVLSALINPYLLAMVFGFSLILPFKQSMIYKHLEKKYILIYPAISLALVFTSWFIIGMISLKQSTNLAVSKSYGLYALNLNSLFNSFGFSKFMPPLEKVSWHQYEGYAYLGLGLMLLIIFTLALFFFARKSNPHKIRKSHFGLILLAALMTLFAITGTITFGEHTLFHTDLPNIIYKLGDTFRASARFFWLSYYLIIFTTLIYFSTSYINLKIKYIVLSLLLIIQLLDLNPLLTQRKFEYGSYKTPFNEEIWLDIFKEFKVLCTYPPFENHLLTNMDYQDLDFLANKANKPITNGYVARETTQLNTSFKQVLDNELYSDINPDYLFITTAEYINMFRAQFEKNAINISPLDGYYLIYSKNKLQSNGYINDNKIISDSIAKIYSSPSILINYDLQQNYTHKLVYYFDDFYSNNNVIRIKGWSFIEDIDNNLFDSTYLIFSNSKKSYYYPINKIKRLDLNSFYNRTDLENSGFNLLIISDSLINQTFQIGFAFKDKNRTIYNGLTNKIIYDTKSVVTKTQMNKIDSNIIYSIDKNSKDKDIIEIYGWAYIPNQNSSDKEHKIILSKDEEYYEIETNKINRNDVTLHYNSGYNFDNSGFSVKFNPKNLPPGEYSICIAIFDTISKKYAMKITDTMVIIEN